MTFFMIYLIIGVLITLAGGKEFYFSYAAQGGKLSRGLFSVMSILCSPVMIAMLIVRKMISMLQ